jgi:ectoine hydroxylase-related dioxygenase (phytanoyl-CoA dioxygenase family)
MSSVDRADPPLEHDAVGAFRRDGVVVLRGLLGPESLETLARGVERNLAALSPLGMNATRPGEPGAFIEDFRNWQRIPEYEDVIRNSRLGGAAGELLGADEVRLFHDHLLVKEAGTLDRSPWHQDQPYYCIDGGQTVSFWIPLDPVDRESTLEFVAGSHAGRWFMPRSFVKGTSMVFDEGALEEVPDIDSDRDAWPIRGWAMDPGDAVAFNMLTLHAAAGSPRRRRAFSVRLIGDDVRYAPRPHRTSPPFDELADGVLEPGAPMEHELFPVLWRRAAAT